MPPCTWCGHPAHAQPCPGQITVGVTNGRPILAACPCVKEPT